MSDLKAFRQINAKTNESFLLCEQNGETEEKRYKEEEKERKREKERKSKIDRRY